MEATEASPEDPRIEETREKLDDQRQKVCRKKQSGKQFVELFQTQLERDKLLLGKIIYVDKTVF